MKITAFCLVIAVAGAGFAAGQEATGAQAASPRAFKFDLQPQYLPGYEPARELPLALWDSPMSRLELAVSREQWALRNPGPTGNVVPFQVGPLPLRFSWDRAGQLLVLGPWSPKWDKLSWGDKIAASAQTAFIAWTVIQMVRRPH